MSPLRLLLLMVILAVLAGGMLWQTEVFSAATGLSGVDRVRGYTVGAAADPTFPLPGGDRLVRLVTNALVDPALLGEDVAYGITVEIVRPDGSVEERPLHLKSHRTGPRVGIPDPCFDSEGTPIADSRHVDLSLDPPAQPGTGVRIRGMGAGRVIVRAWSWQPREGSERARRHLALDAEQRRRLGDPLGLLSWDHMTPTERDLWTSGHFARLAALGTAGRDHIAQDFFVRQVQVPEEEEPLRKVLLQSPLTWLVSGPAEGELALRPTPQTLPARLELVAVATTEQPLAQWDIGPDSGILEWKGTLPAGLQTLVLRSSSPTELDLRMVLPGTAMVPPLPGVATAPAEPSTITLRATPVDAQTEAVLDAELPANGEVRMVEVEVWSRGPVDPEVRVSAVGSRQRRVDALRPVFPPNAYDVAVDALGAESPLRGPVRVKVLVPRDVQSLRVAVDQPALLRFRLPFHPSETDPGPPPLVRQVGVADGPAAWSWVRAQSPVEEVEIHLKGRIEPVPPPPPPPPTWLPLSLDPAGLIQRFEALERISGELTGRLLTEINGVVRLAGGAGQTRARWSFEVQDSSLLGTSLPYLLDGVPTGTIRTALSRGTVRLPPLTPGVHSVEAHPPPGIRLFVNLPPAAGETAPAWRARTVWHLTQPVQLRVTTQGDGPRAVNIVAYFPASAPQPSIEVQATVDGGHPRRRESGIYTRSTPARRTWTLPEAAHPDPAVLVDGDRAAIGLPRTLILPLGDDLAPGVHSIQIQANRPLYVRFFAVTPPNLTGEVPMLSWEPESPDE